jgi:hypothetical protein
VTVPGIQLYTVDKELKADVEGTLRKVREIGSRPSGASCAWPGERAKVMAVRAS